jgi:hypothetical protein
MAVLPFRHALAITHIARASFLIVGFAIPSIAQDPANEPSPGEQQVGQKPPNDPPADEASAPSLDDALLEELTSGIESIAPEAPKPKDPKGDDPESTDGQADPGGSAGPARPAGDGGEPIDAQTKQLKALADKMASISKLLGDGRTGTGTQQVQVAVLHDLDELIQQLEQQQQEQQQQQQRQQQRQQQQQQQQQQQDSAENRQQRQQANQDMPQDARDGEQRAGEQTGSRPGEGDPRGVVDPNLPPSQAWQEAVWGHLPDRVREKMRAASVDQFLPQYRDQIEAYFRQLAEANDAP